MRRLLMFPFLILALCMDLNADNLQDLNNSDIYVRLKAFYALIDGASTATLTSEPLKSSLIVLLRTESDARNTILPSDAALGDYFADIISTVVGIQDPRSIASLVDVVYSGNMVADALVAFGPIAVEPVVTRAGDQSPEERGALTITLSKMIQVGNYNTFSDPAILNRIKAALLKSAGDSDPFVAAFAQVGVATLASPSRTPGDVNGDTKVDCSDVAAVRGAFGRRSGQTGFLAAADVNLDGVVDVRDLAFVAKQLPSGTRCQ